jgi:predicted ArsR family transcriptional regulator
VKQGVQNVLYEDKIYRIIYVRCENNEIFKENKMNVTKQTALLEALKNGEELTAKQITARFGIANPTATVSDLRIRGGFAVYANKRTNKRGETFTKYRLGTPTRAVVAAGYRAMALGMV